MKMRQPTFRPIDPIQSRSPLFQSVTSLGSKLIQQVSRWLKANVRLNDFVKSEHPNIPLEVTLSLWSILYF
jgi:hypothetical protein